MALWGASSEEGADAGAAAAVAAAAAAAAAVDESDVVDVTIGFVLDSCAGCSETALSRSWLGLFYSNTKHSGLWQRLYTSLVVLGSVLMPKQAPRSLRELEALVALQPPLDAAALCSVVQAIALVGVVSARASVTSVVGRPMSS